MEHNEKPTTNPHVQLREEFDDWAILFDPETGKGFGLNPTGVYLWKLRDGEHSRDEMLMALRRDSEGVPDDASGHIVSFVDALVAESLVGFPTLTLVTRTAHASPTEGVGRDTKFMYEAPRLIDFSRGQSALGACVTHGSIGGDCATGAGATQCCLNVGGCPTTTTPTVPCCTDGACPSFNIGCCGHGGNTAGACSTGNNPATGQCTSGGHP